MDLYSKLIYKIESFLWMACPATRNKRALYPAWAKVFIIPFPGVMHAINILMKMTTSPAEVKKPSRADPNISN